MGVTGPSDTERNPHCQATLPPPACVSVSVAPVQLAQTVVDPAGLAATPESVAGTVKGGEAGGGQGAWVEGSWGVCGPGTRPVGLAVSVMATVTPSSFQV